VPKPRKRKPANSLHALQLPELRSLAKKQFLSSLFYMAEDEKLRLVHFDEAYEKNLFVDKSLGNQGQA
jgi:hypothetical protein